MTDLFKPTFIRAGVPINKARPPTSIRPPTEATVGQLGTEAESYTYNNEDTTGPHDWPIPSGVAAGDKIFVSLHVFRSNTGAIEDVDSMPAGYDTDIDVTLDTVDSSHYYLFSKTADGTETDTTFTVTGNARIVLISWLAKAAGATLGAVTASTVAANPDDPPPVTVPAAGIYAVYTMTMANKGNPDQTGGVFSTSAGYEVVGYAKSQDVDRRPRTYVQQVENPLNVTTSEDPGSYTWNDTSGFRQYQTWTFALRLDAGDAPLASGDHTHVEADVTDLDHWTEADHDALDHTGLTGVGSTVRVEKGGTVVGTRGGINFIEGTDITLTVTDDSGNDEVDVTITSTASGGGSGGQLTLLDTQTVSGSNAAITFSSIPTGYDELLIVARIRSAGNTTQGDESRFRCGATSVDTGASDYSYARMIEAGTTAGNHAASTAASFMYLGTIPSSSHADDDFAHCIVRVFDYDNADRDTLFQAFITFALQDASLHRSHQGHGGHRAGGAIDIIEIAGNNTAGGGTAGQLEIGSTARLFGRTYPT